MELERFMTLKKNTKTSPTDLLHNSLDWDSPSTKTGTVKRRPNSEDESGVHFTVFIGTSTPPTTQNSLTISTTSSCSTISTTSSTYDNYDYINLSDNETGMAEVETNTRKPLAIPAKLKMKHEEGGNAMKKTAKVSRIATRSRNDNEEGPPKMKKFTFGLQSSASSNAGASLLGYKTRCDSSSGISGYQRILSPGKISDTDSGIASPLSPSSLNSFLGYSPGTKSPGNIISSASGCRKSDSVGLTCMEYQCEEIYQRSDIEELLTDEKIYTDWANHYLEKARSKKRVNSLAADCSDGVLLAEVIESVMCQKIADINRKPKTPSQMLDNINLCLSALRTQHVAGVESVSGQDLRDGRLKAILALFFALSRHKQAAKQRAAIQQQLQPPSAQAAQQEQMTPNRSGIPHKGGSSIPMPGSALPSRRCPPDKVRPVAGSSRAASPALSMIPRGPPAATVASPYQQPPQKNTSMLDKLKLFKSNDRPAPPSNGKRTSSSSGVSSARSERSDSSISLEPTTEIKPVRNASRLKQQRPTKTSSSNGSKNSPQSNKKEMKESKENKEKLPKMSVDVEKHASKVAAIETRSKLVEPKVKVKEISSKHHDKHDKHNLYATPVGAVPAGTGIPKPTAAVKGTSKVLREEEKSKKCLSRETSSTNMQPPLQPKSIGVVSPIKTETKDSLLTESVHSGHSVYSNNSNLSVGTTAGQHSNSSESSVIYKPSSESSCDRDNLIPNRKESLDYITEASIPQPLQEQNIKLDVKDLKELNEVNDISREDKLLNTQGQTQTHVFNISLGNNQPPLQSQLIGQKASMQVNEMNAIKEGVGGAQDEEMNVEPMRPLFRGYCSTLTLPSRAVPSRYPGGRAPDLNGMNGDYCEVSIASGYLSDGEILRNGNYGNHHQHAMHQNGMDLDGYMSEGGNALYARNLQTMPTMNHHQPITNGTPRISPSLTVLAEQQAVGGRRGRVPVADDPPPPPTGPRTHRSGGHRSNGFPPPDKHSNASGQQWKRYTDSPGVGSPPPPPPAPSSPTSSRRDRERRSSPHGSNGSGGSVSTGTNGVTKDKKVRGVPQSFGYVKRGSTSTSTSTTTSTNGHHAVANGTNGVNVGGVGGNGVPQAALANGNGKTAQVSAVPRTKVKVSGGTQTCSSDLQPHKATPQFKSYSLTGNAATQLSQSVRERLMGSQSLPKGAAQEYSLMLRQRPPKASDGSLSDTQAVEAGSPYAPWLRHSNTYSVAPRLSETDSMESLTSLPGHRGSLTHARLLRDSPSRLSRSNSIRSTKSEKLYPSMLHRNNTEPESEPYYCLPVNAVLHWSQPTSPAPGTARTFPLSPTHSNARHSGPKNDEVHGSSISLVSTASSIYSSAEEKQAHEIRKLRRELIDAQEKVQTLTSQLSTNAHVVSAFEQSLSSMTQRLQNLTATSEKKDSELSELKAAMEALRAQSLQAGIGTGLARQPSSDSVSSLSSACSLDKQDKKKKKGWLRSSFTKAFSRNAKVTKVQCQNDTNGENDHHHVSPPPQQLAVDQGQEVQELQKQLREKDLVLTDIRLEALTSAHQLESLKDTVMKMRSEMLSLKQNNERLQRMVSGSVTNIPAAVITSNSMDPLSDLIPTEELPAETEADGKRISISVYLGQPTTFQKYYAEHYEDDEDGSHATTEISIAHTSVGAATSWGQLDNAVRRAFKQHVARLDPGGGLGLGSDSVALYKLGEAERASDSAPPDLLPVGYVVGHVNTLHVVLQPVAALSFEALIPKGVAQRLVSLLAEHRRLVLCGAPGTGKTHLANRLAEFHSQSLGRDPAEAVATFNVDNKSAKELRQYLAHLSEQAAAGDNSMLPCVVVLDNLHKAGPLADALGSLPRNLPCLIGTMAQSACSATSLQLQHGFRWVLVAPHMEPARGLLGRVLRRRLATLELDQGPQPELAAILGWLPRVWQHLNAFLETHSSGDVAIGPRLFLSCPLELDAARAWFADVWNYSLAPYLREAAREGLQLYGRRAAWSDPTQFVLDTYPWPGAPPQGLTSIPAKDVGLETGPAAQAENDGDPLLNMLMRLQEAANYSSPHSNDSDCNSLDSNLTHNNIGTESVS